MKLQTEDDVLRAITKRRKTAPDAGMWAWLVEKDYINEVLLIGEQAFDDLITTIKELESYGWTKQTRHDDGKAPQMLDAQTHEPLGSGVRPHDRVIAISTLLAKEAVKLPQVTSFRRIALDGRLLPTDEVEAWITKQAESEGMPNMRITIPVDDIPMGDYQENQETRPVLLKVTHLKPDGGKSNREMSNTMLQMRNRGLAPSSSIHYSPVQEIYELQEIDEPLYDMTPVKVLGRNLLTVSFNSLHYGIPDHAWNNSSWRGSIPIRADGLLDTLRELGENLNKRYKWDAGQAILFVLTGNTPIVDLMKGEVSITSPFGALSRITITVDPSVSPSEVEAYYRKLRGNKRRHKRMTEKHLKLAIFSATRPDGETWPQKMKAWNEQYSEQGWVYELDDVRNFARDCTSAQKRLLQGYDLW